MGSLLAVLQTVWDIPTAVWAWGMIAAGAATFASLMLVPSLAAPYGRYSTTGWGFLIPGKLAWVTQELWSFAIPTIWLALLATPEQRARAAAPANAVLLAAFLAHYLYRDLVFPFRLRGSKPTPAAVWVMAATFCVYNGYMQTKYFLTEAPAATPLTPRLLAGLALWAGGWAINLDADNRLIRLRKPGETGYKIPRGGAFELVSAANYFGEILEWTGWAIAAGSLPAAAFAAFTFCNLAPRGWRHHQWYQAKFPRYPRKRQAIIPFLW